MKKFLIEERTLARIVKESARQIVEDIAGIPSEDGDAGEGGFDFDAYVRDFGPSEGNDTVSVMELDNELNRFIEDDDAYEFITDGDDTIDFAFTGRGDAFCIEEDLCSDLAGQFGEEALDELNQAITEWWNDNGDRIRNEHDEDWYDRETDLKLDGDMGN